MDKLPRIFGYRKQRKKLESSSSDSTALSPDHQLPPPLPRRRIVSRNAAKNYEYTTRSSPDTCSLSSWTTSTSRNTTTSEVRLCDTDALQPETISLISSQALVRLKKEIKYKVYKRGPHYAKFLNPPLSLMVRRVCSDDPPTQLEATTQFRNLVSSERCPLIDEVITAGVVPRFVEFLSRHDLPQLQFEAAWALTNFAVGSSERTRVVVKHGAVPKFVELLASASDDVREQAVWALGNVAGDSPSWRDLVLSHGALVPLLAQLNENSNLSMLRIATWTLSNFCGGKAPATFEQVKPALPILRHLIYHNDEEVLANACWALHNLSDGPNDKIQAIIAGGVCQRLIELLLHPSPTVLMPALRTMGNIVSGDDNQIQFLIDKGVLPCLLQLLASNHKKSTEGEACWIKEEACRIISNVTAGNRSQIQLETIPLMVEGVWSDDLPTQLEATTQFRNLLSSEHCPPIDEVIKAGVVPRFVEFLSRHDLPQLQFEAAGTLNIVTAGTSEHTRVVINHGAVPKFVQLLASASDDVREQAVCALGIVAGDSPSCRDLVLSHGALVPLLSQLNENSTLSMRRKATWTLYSFCRGEPSLPFEQVKPALSILRHLIYHNDEEVLTDACWALHYLSDGPNKIQAVIEAGVCQRLIELLLHPSPTVLIPALLTVGNIVTGADCQTQFVIDNGVLPHLLQLLTKDHKKSTEGKTRLIKKIACRTISRITGGNRAQIQAVIEAQLVSPLVHLLQFAEFDVKKEAAWAVSNAASGGSHDQIRFLVSQGCIKALCDLLVCPYPGIVTMCLEGLENILKVGEADKEMGMNRGVNLHAQMIDECEGLDKIKKVQIHNNNKISVKILEKYWAEEEEEEQHLQDGGIIPNQQVLPNVLAGGFNSWISPARILPSTQLSC